MSAPVTLTFSVSPVAAASAGIDQHGETAVVVRPSVLTEAARAVLAYLLSQSSIDPTLTQRQVSNFAGSMVTAQPAPLPLTPDAVEDWLETLAAARTAKIAAEASEREARIRDALAVADTGWINRETSKYYVVMSDSDDFSDMGGRAIGRPKLCATGPRGVYLSAAEQRDPRVIARCEHVQTDTLVSAQAEWERRYDEWTAWKAARAQAARDAARANEKAKTDQIAAFLARASESLRKRHARGLLPEAALLASMRDEVFAPLSDLPRYQRLSNDEVRRALDADGDADVSYSTDNADTASDDDIELLERVEALMPGAKVALRVHTASIDGIDENKQRYSVLVTVRAGAFDFSREYAAAA